MSGDGIDFLLSGPVEPGELRAALADALSLPETSVEIIGDIGEITGAPVTAQLDDLDGDFPISVALFVRGDTPADSSVRQPSAPAARAGHRRVPGPVHLAARPPGRSGRAGHRRPRGARSRRVPDRRDGLTLDAGGGTRTPTPCGTGS